MASLNLKTEVSARERREHKEGRADSAKRRSSVLSEPTTPLLPSLRSLRQFYFGVRVKKFFLVLCFLCLLVVNSKCCWKNKQVATCLHIATRKQQPFFQRGSASLFRLSKFSRRPPCSPPSHCECQRCLVTNQPVPDSSPLCVRLKSKPSRSLKRFLSSTRRT